MNTSDEALMNEVKAGAVTKLAVLFERHHRSLFRYLLSLTRNREIAEDLVQDVFFRILRSRATYQSERSFQVWMYQIARNANLDRVRQRHGEVIGIDEFGAGIPDIAASEPDPETFAARNQDVKLLRAAMARLAADKREILVLSRFQGLKYTEIAEVLGCELNTVKVRVHRAMRALEQIYFTLAGEKAS